MSAARRARTWFRKTIAEVAVRHPEELVTDLADLAAGKVLGLPLVIGIPDLAGLDPDIATVVLPRRRS